MNDLNKNAQVLENGFFDIEGRIGRARYAIINLIASIVTVPIFAGIGERNFGGQLFFGLLVLLVLSPTIVKRLHDIDRDGIWLLALFVPFLNIIIQIRLLLQSGTQSANRFGLHRPTAKGTDGSIGGQLQRTGDAIFAARNILKNGESKTSSLPSGPNTDAIYDAIAQEFESGILDKGLWTKLFAECDGNEAKTKANYIKARAAKLSEGQQSHSTQDMPPTRLSTKAMEEVSPASTVGQLPKERARAMEDMIKRMG